MSRIPIFVIMVFFLLAAAMNAIAGETRGILLTPGGACGDKADKFASPLNLRPINPTFQCPRSLWLWNVDYALNQAEQVKLLQFCRDRHINRLYLYTGSKRLYSEPCLGQLRQFMRAARASGLQVEALDGWKDAILPEKQNEFLAALKRIIDYNLSSAPEECFAGFQSDVEPITMKEYHNPPENKPRFDLLYVELHAKCREMIDKSGLKNFVLGMAVQQNLDRDPPEMYITWNNVKAGTLTHLAKIADYFAVMSYHDRADKIVSAAAGEVNLMGEVGRKAWVGVETLDINALDGSPRSLSFYEEGLDKMEIELEKVYNCFAGQAGFGGLAIHHYESYRRMTDGPRDMKRSPPPQLVAKEIGQVKIDGKDGEWGNILPVPATGAGRVVHGRAKWKGEVDLGAEFRFAWDSGHVYVLATVKDDHYCFVNGGEDIWKWDHIELWFNVPGHGEIFQLGLTPGNFDRNPGNVYLWHPTEWSSSRRAGLAQQVEYAAERLPEGYRVECIIPAILLGLEKFKPGDKIKILAEAGDADDPKEPCRCMVSIAPKRDRGEPDTFAVLELKTEK